MNTTTAARKFEREITKRQKQIGQIKGEMMRDGATEAQLDTIAYLSKEIEQWADMRNTAAGLPVQAFQTARGWE